ncbi:DNA-binding response regulator [Myxococcaceae bacterium GXIMD 01537]
MASSLPRHAVLHAADASLEALLRDVLSDLGIEVRGAGDAGARPDVVLALVQRGDSVPRVLETAGAPRAPVVLVLPFADERLVRHAVNQGARGCYALGTPLDELRRLLMELCAPAPGIASGAGLSEGPGTNSRGRHHD